MGNYSTLKCLLSKNNLANYNKNIESGHFVEEGTNNMSFKRSYENFFKRGEKKMKEVVQFLQANPVQYLATVGRDGKAKCRPFMFCLEQEGKLWFCTNNTKDVFKDMQANPEIEVCVSSPEYSWIRLNGKAVFENNMAVKEACMLNPIVKETYKEASNPIIEVFYLGDAKAVIAEFSGNPPKEYNL